MERSQYLDALAAESDAFYRGAASCSLDAPVPSCPEWTAYDLVYHMGEVHHFWGEIARRRLSSPDSVQEPPLPAPELVVAWARGESATLQEILSEADPSSPVWTWARRKDVGFIVRRMALETAVHRWDMEQAAGHPAPIDADLARDGVDEILGFMVDDPRVEAATVHGSVHLHATDGPGEWLVREADDGSLTVVAEHAKGDAAVRGPISDLLLVLWRRVGLDAVEVIGDREVAERLVSRTSFD